MKMYLLINPINNNPYEIAYTKKEDNILNNEIDESGNYITKIYKPIYLEIEKYDSALFYKKYNPDTGKLE